MIVLAAFWSCTFSSVLASACSYAKRVDNGQTKLILGRVYYYTRLLPCDSYSSDLCLQTACERRLVCLLCSNRDFECLHLSVGLGHRQARLHWLCEIECTGSDPRILRRESSSTRQQAVPPTKSHFCLHRCASLPSRQLCPPPNLRSQCLFPASVPGARSRP